MHYFKLLKLFVFSALIFLSGCATVNTSDKVIFVQDTDRWVLLPFLNNTQMPGAARNVEDILSSLVIIKKRITLTKYRDNIEHETPLLLIDDVARYEKGLAWARQHGFRYGISGSVNEWRYKAGLDGEPAVGITVKIIDVKTGHVVWSGTGARSGWGRESVSMTAQRVVLEILERMKIERQHEKRSLK